MVFKSKLFTFNSYEYFLEWYIKQERDSSTPDLTEDQKRELLKMMHYVLKPSKRGDGFYFLYDVEREMYDGEEEWVHSADKAMTYGGVQEAFERFWDIIIPDWFEEDEDYMEDFYYKLELSEKKSNQEDIGDYLYALYAWGGFFNEENAKIHLVNPKNYENVVFFKNKEDRDAIIYSLNVIADDMQKKGHSTCKLMITTHEGYDMDKPVVCHRVSEYKGKRVHTTFNMKIGTTIQDAMFWMNEKWYPGHNDYPFGTPEVKSIEGYKHLTEEYDPYNSDDFKIIQEWVTGAFDLKDYFGRGEDR